MIRLHPANRSVVNEQIEVENYFNYLGPKETAPDPKTYVRPGLQRNPTDPDNYMYTRSDGTTRTVSDERADEFSNMNRRMYAKSVRRTADKLDSLYPESTPRENKIISDYVKDSKINHRMVAGNLIPGDREKIDALSNVISQPAPDDMVVYSGTNPDHADILAKHDVVPHPSFLSTTISPNGARTFAQKDIYGKRQGAIMKIHIPKGHPTALVRSGGQDGEHEILLRPNTKIKIDRSKEHAMVGQHGYVTVHHCEIV